MVNTLFKMVSSSLYSFFLLTYIFFLLFLPLSSSFFLMSVMSSTVAVLFVVSHSVIGRIFSTDPVVLSLASNLRYVNIGSVLNRLSSIGKVQVRVCCKWTNVYMYIWFSTWVVWGTWFIMYMVYYMGCLGYMFHASSQLLIHLVSPPYHGISLWTNFRNP